MTQYHKIDMGMDEFVPQPPMSSKPLKPDIQNPDPINMRPTRRRGGFNQNRRSLPVTIDMSSSTPPPNSQDESYGEQYQDYSSTTPSQDYTSSFPTSQPPQNEKINIDMGMDSSYTSMMPPTQQGKMSIDMDMGDPYPPNSHSPQLTSNTTNVKKISIDMDMDMDDYAPQNTTTPKNQNNIDMSMDDYGPPPTSSNENDEFIPKQATSGKIEMSVDEFVPNQAVAGKIDMGVDEFIPSFAASKAKVGGEAYGFNKVYTSFVEEVNIASIEQQKIEKVNSGRRIIEMDFCIEKPPDYVERRINNTKRPLKKYTFNQRPKRKEKRKRRKLDIGGLLNKIFKRRKKAPTRPRSRVLKKK